MDALELEQYLHRHIPLSKAMAVSVISISPEGVVLGAPLGPNINHRETAFGGSVSALATLSAWALLQLRIVALGVTPRLVIQSNSMSYERPISGNFTAQSFLPKPDSWQPFVRMLERRGRARIIVSSTVFFSGQEAGHFEGQFVALGLGDAL